MRIGDGIVRKANTTIQLLDVDYHVVGDVSIGDGTGTVDVEDGVTFYNDTGVRWSVGYSGTGDLTATATNGIVWTSAQTSPAKGDWEGIHILASSSSATVLDGVTVEYAGDSLGAAVYCYFATPTVSNSTLSYSSGYGFFSSYCSATLSGNTYTNNDGPDTN